jgi:hypothetical protein
VTPDAAERGVEALERVLADEGPLDRDRLRDHLTRAGIRTQGQAFVHLLGLASIRGLIVRGPMVGAKHAFVLVRDWLGDIAPVGRDVALAELARRYLAGHGPADARDLARWAGLAISDARAGLRAIAAELTEREDGLVDLKHRPSAGPLPGPRLLGAFEPVLLGWQSRHLLVGKHEPRLVSGGIFRPFALLRGRAAAVWTNSSQGLELEPFARLTRADRAALEADAADVARFLAG